MRIEGYHDGFASDGVGALGHVPHHLLVRDVDAVEVADADDGWAEVMRELLRDGERLAWLAAS